MAEKILLDAGMSPRGWSFRGKALYCLQDWAYSYAYGRGITNSEPLARGSLVHIGFAHYRARIQAAQQGWDPEVYYTPDEAIEIVAYREDDQRIERAMPLLWRPLMAQCKLTVANRRKHDMLEGMPEIIAVEQLLGGWFDRNGMVDAPPDAEHRLSLMGQGVPGWIELAKLGAPYYHSARADWIYKSGGYYWIGDTKTAFKVDRTKVDGYAMSGQMHGLTWFGLQAYGQQFGGITVDFAVMSSQQFPTHRMPAAPGAVRDFPLSVAESEERLARLLLEGRSFDRYPKTLNEQVCVRRYGPHCEHYLRCRLGKK